ncbi:MAG: AAC(3) family N-acetyltransferase [Clostridia bacterium]|nr:AAC(3) family N-acetyltransferase [Clostridia bacterium]
MYKKEQIISMLSELSLERDSIIMLHCSERFIEDVEGGEDALLDILCDFLADGLLIIPTYTWATVCGDNITFDSRSEPSCVGTLGMKLLSREKAVRTLHPSHSLAVWGDNAERFADGEQMCSTPCPRSGCMGKMLDWRGKLLFLGTDLSECTFLHGIEEWGDIGDRIGEPEMRYIVMGDGSICFASMSAYESSTGDVSKNYVKVEKSLIKLGAGAEYDLDGTRCMLFDCAAMVRIVSELLIFAPDIFADDAPVSRTYIKNIRESLKQKR